MDLLLFYIFKRISAIKIIPIDIHCFLLSLSLKIRSPDKVTTTTVATLKVGKAMTAATSFNAFNKNLQEKKFGTPRRIPYPTSGKPTFSF